MNRSKLERATKQAAKLKTRYRYAIMSEGSILGTASTRDAAREERRRLALITRGAVYVLDRSYTPARMVR